MGECFENNPNMMFRLNGGASSLDCVQVTICSVEFKVIKQRYTREGDSTG